MSKIRRDGRHFIRLANLDAQRRIFVTMHDDPCLVFFNLMRTVFCEFSSQVCQLLKRGANQDVTTLAGKTALDIAMDNMNADIVTLLRLSRLNDEIKETDVLNPGDFLRRFFYLLSSKMCV